MPLMPSPSSPREAWISWPVISESCQVVVAGLVDDWLLVGVVLRLLVVLVRGDGDVAGGGGERRRLVGVIRTMGLLCFAIEESTCLASGDGVDD